MKEQVQHNNCLPVHMLPFTSVSANYHNFSSYFQVKEWLGTEILLQPIDRGWALVNKRPKSLNIDLPLANCSCEQTFDTLN